MFDGNCRKDKLAEMILESLGEYKLPDADAEKIANIGRMLKSFKWDEMEELLKE